MNKGIILRASLILGTFLIIILVAVGCEVFDGAPVEAKITNPDAVYLTVDGLEVTNQEIWDVMKNVDGLDYLAEYIEAFLLADYVDAVTQADIDKEIRLLTYLTEDETVIAKIVADEQAHQDYLDAFRQNVEVLGFDPEDPASIREFIELSIAKRAYVKDQIINAGVDDQLYVDGTTIIEYYDQTTFGNACTLDIRFQNTLEADSVFSHFNLVPNYEGGIGLYTGTEDIETLAKGDFVPENTSVLTSEEAWGMYVKIYNYMNPWLTPLSEDITTADYCTNYADSATKVYDDLVKYKSESDPNVLFAQYIYTTLDLSDEEVIPYTYNTNKVFGDYIMMVYKVSQEDVAEYGDLTVVEQDELKSELYDTLLTDTVIAATIQTLKEDKGFELFDPQFQLKYEFQTGKTFDNKGSETLVAKVDGLDVSADDLFEFMLGRIGTFYSLEVAKVKLLINSDSFDAIYGSSRDYINNKSDKMVEHRDSVREMKSIFSSNGYSTYGYSSSAMTWEEFIYLAFGVEGEEDLIKTMFVMNELQFDFMFDRVSYESSVAYMQDKVDNYFSLNVSHLLIFIDFDFDFVPDDFSDFTDGLTTVEQTEFQALKVSFENLLASKFNEGKTLQNIVDEYTKALMGDTTSEYYDYKNYGFFIMTENLGNIDHYTVGNLDDSFGTALKRIYTEYSQTENSTAAKYTDDQVVVTDFGIHLIEVTKGTDFVMKSAEFEFTTENSGSFSDGSEGTTVIPNKAQVELYLEIQKQVAAGDNPSEILPTNVTAAIEYYYGPVYDAYMSQTGFSIAMAEYAFANNLAYTTDDAASKEALHTLIDVFYEVNFPEFFDKDAQ